MQLQRIMIADDEEVQREGLAGIVRKITPCTDIITCSNGAEVCEKLKDHQTELLITDICMPVMDGMELIQKAAAEYPALKVVLISAYQEFEYARNAMKCGVSEYLIKPFRVSDVRKLLDRIGEEMQQEQEKSRRLQHYDSLMEQRQEEETQQMLTQLVIGKKQSAVLNNKAFNSLGTAGTIAVIRWKAGGGSFSDAAPTAGRSSDLLGQITFMFRDCIHIQIKQGMKRSEEKTLLFLPGTGSAEVVFQLEQMLNQVKKEGMLFWAGVSNTKQNLLECAMEGANQAEEALAFQFYYAKEGRIFSYEVLNHILEKPIGSLSPYEREIRQAVCRGDGSFVEHKLKQLMGILRKEPFYYPNKVRHRVSSMMVSIIKDMEGAISQLAFDELLNEAYLLFGSCDSFEDLFLISQKLLMKASALFTSSIAEYDVIETCISYIKAHLDEELSLQYLAEKTHFHPNYLSAQIKLRLGLSYSSYLLSMRMEAACQYLKETDKKVADVGKCCGFKDSSYFIRVFRKECKMSPEQYRKLYLDGRDHEEKNM